MPTVLLSSFFYRYEEGLAIEGVLVEVEVTLEVEDVVPQVDQVVAVALEPLLLLQLLAQPHRRVHVLPGFDLFCNTDIPLARTRWV